MRTNSFHLVSAVSQKLDDYKLLVKFRLNLLVVFSAISSFYIAKKGDIIFQDVFVLALGGFFLTGGANALNQIIEKEYDKMMSRTADRPLPTGRMGTSEAVLAAGLMSVVGLAFLALFNPMTAVLGSFSLLLYAFVYTPMKRVSPVAVLIGAVPGALPMMIGCVAAEGSLTGLAVVLFGIQFLWQFPHFWAIAWLSYNDYEKAGFFLLPSPNGQRDKNVGFQSLLYSTGLLFLCVVPYFMGVVGVIGTFIILIMSFLYIYYSFMFYRNCDDISARKLMFCSFAYLPVVLFSFVLDLM